MENYEVLNEVGSGSFGKVCKIRRKADNKLMAWKEIFYGKMSEKEKGQIVAEVNILRDLRNPFIVRYYDRIIDKATSKLYIVMEMCSGGDLGKVIKKCKKNNTNLDEAVIWKVFAQATVALKECHRHQEPNADPASVHRSTSKPIIHRDIKPANILIDESQNIKIGDFGLAKELSNMRALTQTNVGTPFYMSPELLNGKAYDERCDIWALGCVLYELAALKPPFDARTQADLTRRVNSGRLSRIPNKYSNELNSAISSMLVVDTSSRPRVEELEKIPSLQGALNTIKFNAKEDKLQQGISAKNQELSARETAVAAKEEELRVREAKLVERENKLNERETQFNQQKHKVASSAPASTTALPAAPAKFTIYADEPPVAPSAAASSTVVGATAAIHRAKELLSANNAKPSFQPAPFVNLTAMRPPSSRQTAQGDHENIQAGVVPPAVPVVRPSHMALNRRPAPAANNNVQMDVEEEKETASPRKRRRSSLLALDAKNEKDAAAAKNKPPVPSFTNLNNPHYLRGNVAKKPVGLSHANVPSDNARNVALEPSSFPSKPSQGTAGGKMVQPHANNHHGLSVAQQQQLREATAML